LRFQIEVLKYKIEIIMTYGWPYISVRRDDFRAVEEDKWFGVKRL